MLKGSETLRLLLALPSTDQAESIVSNLKNLGVATRPNLVEDFDELVESLNEGNFDILISADQIDSYSIDGILNAVRRLGRDIPVVIITRSPDVELRKHALMAGAVDALSEDTPELTALIVRRELASLYVRRAERHLQSALNEAESRNKFLLDNSSEAIAYLHDGMHIYVNNAYVALFGYSERDELDGLPIIDLVDPHDLNSFKLYLKSQTRREDIVVSSKTTGNQDTELHFKGIKSDASTFKAVMTLSSAFYEGETCTQIIIRVDADEGIRAELELQRSSLKERLLEAETVDTLTGLANRKRFESVLSTFVTQAHVDKTVNTLMYLSIDRFNQLMAEHGPLASDQIIQAVSVKITEHFKRKDLVFRFAEATITALLADTGEMAALNFLNTLVHDIKQMLIQLQNGRNLFVTISIGVLCFSETARKPEDLLALVAAENGRASGRGGNQVCVYDPAQHANNSSTAMHEVLTNALANNKFKLLFQSLVDVKEEGSPFYEVYLRLPINEEQILEPEQFLPAALQDRRDKMALKIDRWVLLNSCKQLKEHLKLEPYAKILVNLSAESLLDASLPDWIGKLAKVTSKNPETLILQFQEQDVFNYLSQTSTMIDQLKQAGCGFSISRFGLSVEPMKTLEYIAASYIKLDGSFTKDLNSAESVAKLKAMVDHLNNMDKTVIIPFVESTATLSKLWTIGARYLQGYFLHSPGERLGSDNNS